MVSNFKFEVGKWYSNRVKQYLVTGIDGNRLSVEYEDGTQGMLSADVQRIIVENMKRDLGASSNMVEKYGLETVKSILLEKG